MNLTTEQEAHLAGLKERFLVAVDLKYRAGAAQHGGDIWAKPGILEMLRDELLDAYVYVDSLILQRDSPSLINPEAHDIDHELIDFGHADCSVCEEARNAKKD